MSARKNLSEEQIKRAQAVMKSIYTSMSDPAFNKSDILRIIKTNLDDDPTLEKIFGNISDDMMSEMIDMEQDSIEMLDDGTSFDTASAILDKGSYKFETLDILKMDKKQKHAMTGIPTIEEARFLEDIYYQTQAKRIAVQNQLRSLNQGKDSEINDNAHKSGSKNRSFLEWYFLNNSIMEDEIAKAIALFSDSNYLSRWAKSVIGIGPIYATCLAANLTIIDDGVHPMSAGAWWSFCGLNDNLRPWLGKAKSLEIVNRLVAEADGVIDDALVYKLINISGWSMAHYEKHAKSEKTGAWSKDKLVQATSMIPYNRRLKTLCFKIGKSFMFNSKNPNSLYGRLYRERKEFETRNNMNGLYANQAFKIIQEKNFKKSTTAYSYYSKGMLPPAHIDMRARRFAVKLFISHCYEAAYYNKYGKPAPMPYMIAYQDHKDYIGPEVPYDSIERDPQD